MNRRQALLLTSILALIIVASLILYSAFFPSPNPPAYSNSIVWESGLEHFAAGFTVADRKVFATDVWSNLLCYDANNGKSLWNATTSDVAGYAGGQVIVYEGKVYVAALDLTIKRFNENTGEVEMQYTVPNDYSTPYKIVPSFFIADGKLFGLDGNTIAVYDLATGKELWQDFFRTGHIIYDIGNSLPRSNYAFVHYDSNYLTTERLDPNNGNVIWNYSGYTSGDPIVTQEQVILWNYATTEAYNSARNQGVLSKEQAIVCISTETGEKSWDFDTGTSLFQPTISNGLLFFGSQDGYFYALNIADGTLKWKTHVDSLGLTETYRRYLSEEQITININAPAPFIDTQKQTVYWSLFLTQYAPNLEDNNYSRVILSLDLQTGDKKWVTPINGTSTYRSVGDGRMTLLNNRIFIAGNTGLLCLDSNSGSLLWARSFDHYVWCPILADNKVFVATDLYITAYR